LPADESATVHCEVAGRPQGETALLVRSSEQLTLRNHRIVARSFGREGFTFYDSLQAAVWGSPAQNLLTLLP